MGSAVAGTVPHLRDAAEAQCRRDPRDCLMPAMSTPEQKKQNLKLALILASVAVVFFVGFFAKAALFGI